MDLSIIIPTFNKARYLNMVLFSIKKNIGIDDIEILVVDDGSTDDTKQVVTHHEKHIQLKYLYQKKQGLSSARNNGIKNASAESILFLDDDRVLEKEYLMNIDVKRISDVTIGRRREIYYSSFQVNEEGFKKAMFNDFADEQKKIRMERYYNKTLPLASIKTYIPWVGCTFSNTLIKKAVFENIGLFEERFTGWGFEDLELAYRAYISGFEFSWDDEMGSIHIYHTHSNSLLEQREVNFRLFCEKYGRQEVMLYREFMENKIDVCEYNEKVKDMMMVNQSKSYY